MKKKVIGVILIIFVTITSSCYIFFIDKDINLSLVEISNIDALATCGSSCEICWMDYNNWKCSDVGYSGCSVCTTY